MARLPTPGGDDNVWGNVLNDFLSAEHNSDGSQKPLNISKLTAGSNGEVLTTSSGTPTWAAPTGGAPTGSAGGVLSGTYPNPGFAADMATQAELDAVDTAKIAKSIVDAKGDLLAASANDTVTRLAVGSNDQVLTADSAQATGLKWATPAGGAPSGPAGGVLGGTYPDPTFAVDMVTQAELTATKLDDLATPDDNTDLNASTTRHGLLRKLDNSATNFLNGQGNWTAPGTSGDINVKGFRSINAYGAQQGVFSSQNASLASTHAALVADGGGTVWFPPGTTSLQGPITIPAGVHWLGAGPASTLLAFNLPGGDTGAGTYAVQSADQFTETHISNLKLHGPAENVGTSFLGTSPCGISALKGSRKLLLEDVWIERWHGAVAMWGDHMTLNRVVMENCYIGLDYIDSTARGDQVVNNCVATGMLLACMFVHGGTNVNHSTFNQFHMIGSPFGVLRTGAATEGMLISNSFINCGFENVGNGAYVDLSTGGQPSWDSVEIINSGWTQNNAYKWAGLSSAYTVNLPIGGTNCMITNDFWPFTAGTTGIYNTAGGIVIDNTPRNNMFSTAGRILMSQFASFYQSFTPSGTVAVGDVLELSAASTVRRATGTSATNAVIGVAVTASGTGPTVLVRQNGGHSVLSEAVVLGDMLAQKTGTYNVVGKASNYPSNPVIGFATAAGGNDTTPSVVSARLGFPI